MSITEHHRWISSLGKGNGCLSADKLVSLDREHEKEHNIRNRSVSMPISSVLALADVGYNIENRRFSSADALIARKTHFSHQTRLRSIQLKKSKRRQKRISKNEEQSKTYKVEKVVHTNLDIKESTKLIEVYGRYNVGRASFMQLLKSYRPLDTSDEKCSRIVLEENDTKTCLIFKAVDICREKTIEDDEADVCVVMFAVSDTASFQFAKMCVQSIRRSHREDVPIFLVANKSDMIRYRKVSTNDAMRVADLHKCQYIETSLTLNHNVKELLRGILKAQVENSKPRTRFLRLRRIAKSFRNRMKCAFFK